jgi:putative endonuclease
MDAWSYIIFSHKLNRFYIGSTELLPEQRLELHLGKAYGKSKFTAKSDDWELFLSIQCNSISQARKIESHLKKMRNTKYFIWLAQNPDAIDKIKDKYL